MAPIIAGILMTSSLSALTFGQEFELIWMQRWSRMTFLYISVRYIGILYAVINILPSLPSLPVTDIVSVPHQNLSFPFNNVHRYGGVSDIVGQLVGYNDRNRCHSLNSTLNWMTVTVNTMLGVIMITRLHAMYQRSRKILIFLVVIFVASTIACGVVTAIGDIYMLGEELILSGTYQCIYEWEGDISLDSMAWVLYITWEILALCLAVWITVKHFRELRRSSTGQAIGDCFMVLMKTHVLYFVSFAVVSSFQLSHYSPNLKTKALETGTLMYTAHLEIYSIVQMFVLGPRLILSIREYHTKLVDNSDAGTGISTITFREHGYVSTGGDV
ncbi:uncharacterized protein HD556DRAFT_1436981 [Suillus plorans]|uniref:DUF6533 domain-containing protein n=1 Tax=Suillus plorans TaxID=116603 RepID=A0A9P7DWC2_9AGAM|nr:uncharacterized protein HD556DRAFT_1436981 [Suillus plorans]KAG1804814.1 hypothetical protein HD556DRAFT_1436981 [Suillus plorans]